MKQVTVAEGVELTAEWVATPTAVQLPYKIRNKSSRKVYVSVLAHYEQGYSVRPYSWLASNDSLLILSFVRSPVPPGVEIYVPFLSLCRPIAAGEEWEGIAEWEVPVKEQHPYGGAAYPKDPIPLPVSETLFALEFLKEGKTHLVDESPHRPGFYRVGGAEKTYLHIRFRLDQPLTVLKRTDEFYRFPTPGLDKRPPDKAR